MYLVGWNRVPWICRPPTFENTLGIQIVLLLRLSYHFVYRSIFVGIYLRFIQIQEPVIMITRQKLSNEFIVPDLWIDGFQLSPRTGEELGCITTQFFQEDHTFILEMLTYYAAAYQLFAYEMITALVKTMKTILKDLFNSCRQYFWY